MEYHIDCAPVYPLRILSRKWAYHVLKALAKPRSFSQLQAELKHVTNHILSRELKLLQSEQLIQSDGQYRLTQAGTELLEATTVLMDWSVRHKRMSPCPLQQDCSACSRYPITVGARRKN
jgi:DNA-binding HxlR family transcriptional regulator